MASIQVPCEVEILIRKPDGKMYPVLKRDVYALAPGGSPDGAIANTPDVWAYAPISAVTAFRDDELIIKIKTVAAATLDASDAKWIIPLTIKDEGIVHLGNNSTDFDVLVLADTAYVAAQETFAAIHRFKKTAKFGGDKIFLSIEDNTA